MATTITKNWISADNKLFKSRLKDEMEQIKVNGKWVNLTERGRYIKTRTLYVTFINHKSTVSKSFKQGKRYQVDMTASIGQNAGKIFDEDGDAWALIRSDDVGFTTVCGTYRFESQYK